MRGERKGMALFYITKRANGARGGGGYITTTSTRRRSSMQKRKNGVGLATRTAGGGAAEKRGTNASNFCYSAYKGGFNRGTFDLSEEEGGVDLIDGSVVSRKKKKRLHLVRREKEKYPFPPRR